MEFLLNLFPNLNQAQPLPQKACQDGIETPAYR